MSKNKQRDKLARKLLRQREARDEADRLYREKHLGPKNGYGVGAPDLTEVLSRPTHPVEW